MPMAFGDESMSVRSESPVQSARFDETTVLHELEHYLPKQAPLKDFVHHNTLHAFQNLKFHDALRNASGIFGYNLSLKLDKYRDLYQRGEITPAVLDWVVRRHKGDQSDLWKTKLVAGSFAPPPLPRIGAVRANWKKNLRIDLDSLVHPLLFRILCSYLDQGISMWTFPSGGEGFLCAIRELERHSFTSFFRRERARRLLLEQDCSIADLLKLLVRDEALFERYLFDQQFAHPGWSGMVTVIEAHPDTLIDSRRIGLRELIVFELLLEIDALDEHFDEQWSPLEAELGGEPLDILAEVPRTELHDALAIWQEALEWSFYDPVLSAIQRQPAESPALPAKSFQGLFCIDDRICSFRRHIESFDPHCETYGTPGFFGVEFYFKPKNAKSHTKVCPGPIEPRYLIKETGSQDRLEAEPHFSKHSHDLLGGWVISQTLGFWSAVKLFNNILKPSASPLGASSFRHMDRASSLTILNRSPDDREDGLQIGFSVAEMAERAENLLGSIGLTQDFAPIVYVVGHGASNTNNPHYAAYDCGACSGRPGSVNARVICFMLNHPEVRAILAGKGIEIPATTQFVGALHDTTRDEIAFYDEDSLSPDNLARHRTNVAVFDKALALNAKERSRRFELTDSQQSPERVHEAVKARAVSLFEPRPELNHATNALCIVGRRFLSRKLFLDRRSFLNSYDYRVDPDGKFLLGILRAAAPVCGGINLEYFFSHVDNQKLGAGSKLPHNVMGLIGVANGNDGDLRPGLPSQMIEVHHPVRMMIVVEHFPEVVLNTIRQQPATWEWFANEWLNLTVVNPETHELFRFRDGTFEPYRALTERIDVAADLEKLFETQADNLPVLELR
ncbi:YbcC family protein [Azorhizophilus paspali]|uniref:Probable inorganic carbon transporter subunit DabA n=1 Tax=Azorhizophilus paspali TaxID=69963 RepID=A0ABV6SKI1_AZOPA